MTPRLLTPREVSEQWRIAGHRIWAKVGTGDCFYRNDGETPVAEELLAAAAAHGQAMYRYLMREPQLSGFAPGASRLHMTVVIGDGRHGWLCGLGAPRGDDVWDGAPPFSPRDPRTWLCLACVRQIVKREIARDREAALWRWRAQERRV